MSRTPHHLGAVPGQATTLGGTTDMREEAPEKEAWAAALARRVEAEFRQLPSEGQSSAARSSGSDGALTGTREPLDGGASKLTGMTSFEPAKDGKPSDVTKLMGELDGGPLGKVRFAIMRGSDGIRVVLGVEQARQRALTSLETSAVQQSLAQAGLNVASVRVTTPEAAGIAFAQYRREGKSSQGDSPTDAYREHHKRAKPTPEGELSLIG